MALPEPLSSTVAITKILEQLKVPYFIGGSLASTVHGEIRTTQDSDIVAQLTLHHIKSFVSSVEEDFFIDEEMVQEAIRRNTSFNLVHRRSFFRVDVFIPPQDPFNQSQLRRAKQELIFREPATQAVIASAEDVLLAKLNWYKAGGESSERQWRDVLGILKVQGDRLDARYLQAWADKISVAHLLARAIEEASPGLKA